MRPQPAGRKKATPDSHHGHTGISRQEPRLQ